MWTGKERSMQAVHACRVASHTLNLQSSNLHAQAGVHTCIF
jgi:hypothetical protein